MPDYALAEAFVQIRPDTAGFRAEAEAKIKAAMSGIKVPDVKVKLTPDVSGFAAAAKAAVTKALAGAGGAIPVKIKFDADAGEIARQMALLKTKMAQQGVVDFLDFNLPIGKIQYQIALLRRLLQQGKVTDFLGVGLNQGDVLKQGMTLRTALQRELGNVNIGVGLGGADEAAREAAKAAAIAALGGPPVTQQATAATGGEAAAGAQADITAGALLKLAAATTNAGDAAKLAYAANTVNKIAMQQSGRTADDTGKAMDRLAGRLTTQIPLWGGLAGTAGLVQIGLHAALEGFVAIIPAALALGVTLYGLLPAAQDIFNHLNSIDIVNTNLGSSIPPLTGKFAALQSALAPAALELYGGGLNLINRNTGVLGQTLTAVSHLLETWIANIDIWGGHQQNVGRILQTGVAFLHQWGTVFGELGIALDNLIKADPGIAHLLMDVIEGALKLLDVVTKLPTPLLTVVLALHGVYIWGGLAATGLQRLAAVSGIDTLATKMGLLKTETVAAGTAAEATSRTFIGLSGATWAGILALAAALAYVAFESTQADGSTKKFLATLDASLSQMPASQALTAIPAAISKIDSSLSNFKPPGTYSLTTIANQARAEWQDLGDEISQIAHGKFGAALDSIGHIFGAVFNTSQANSIAYANDLKLAEQHVDTYINSLGTLGQEMGALGKKGFTAQQALALMDLAGVQSTDTFAVMQQKVANLITGYQNMSVQAGILANSVDAVTLASEIQSSNISALTGAWTTFFQLVSGGIGGFTTFEQDLVTLTGKQLPGLSTATLATSQNFLTAAQAAQTEANALMQQASAAGLGTDGTDLLTSSVKDMVAQLLPAAKGSQNFTTILYALAQQGGYNGANSFQALSQWVRTASGSIGAAGNPSKQLDKNISTLAADSANLTTDMNNLSNAISQNLNQAMSQAIFQATGGQKTFDNFANAVLHAHGNTQLLHGSAQALASQLIATTGNTRQAMSEFEVFAEKLGLSKAAADALWNSLSHNPKVVTTSIVLKAIAEGQGGVNVASPGLAAKEIMLSTMAAGGMVTGGTPGRDSVLIAAMPGEVVVPASKVPMMSGALSAAGVPGFAAGGIVAISNMTNGLRAGTSSAMAGDSQFWLASDLSQVIRSMSASYPAGPVSGGQYALQQYAASLFHLYGWAGDQILPLGALWNRESGWNRFARNPSSGAYGIAQALPPTKYPFAGQAAGGSSAAAQISWGEGYIAGRYGTPAAAWGHELSAGWYDHGGWLMPGASVAVNRTGRPEWVSPPGGSADSAITSRLDRLIALMGAAPAASGNAVAASLNGVSRRAITRAMYPNRVGAGR